jgi:carboxyl-terminal processing protease
MRSLHRLPAALIAALVLASAPGDRGGVALQRATAQPPDAAVGKDYRLDKLQILSRVIVHIKDNYVDPKRIDPKAMIVSALDMVEKTAAEVMVDGDAKAGKVTVTVGSASRVFDISEVDSIWKITPVMHDVMGFIQQHLLAHDNVRDIEYAAVNGMLSTLDPHSVMLEPKYFKEMKLQTKGEFGGLGFVITMKESNLTVMKVLKNTPAQRAGIKARDVITKIEEQSTINMELQDAVDLLRGKPNSRVAITINRTGWPEPKRMSITREVINVESIPWARLLENNVGYVRLVQFSANSTRDLSQALAQQRAQAGGQLRGLVLDLRGNPGGLLEQAIQVSDLFLSDGTIVSTVGEGDRVRIHEVKEAHSDRDDLNQLPVVVLVNNSSASASEIVAGALKNNNRALVVGRQTFGKGSVQVLYDFADPARPTEESALKLTIAQYLTPGGISIQEVGVTPDVLLLPGRVLKDAVNVFAPPRLSGEADLERHFSNPLDDALTPAEREKRAEERRKRVEKAPLELRYLLDEKEDKVAQAMKAEAKREEARKARGAPDDDLADLTPEEQEDVEADNPDEFVEDYQIRFARDLLARAGTPDRTRLLEAAKGFVAERRQSEEARVKSKLEQLGIDWSTGPASGTPRPVVTVTPAPGQRQLAGETMPWTVTVENRGDGPLRRLRAWTSVEKNALLDRREFVFGTVKPGEKKSWTVPVKLPKSLESRRDDVGLHFQDEHGKAPPEVRSALDMVEIPHPLFAFSVQVDDQSGGNGNGLIERGEEVTLRVDVRNAGSGKGGEKTFVSLKNLGDDKIFIKKGRQAIGTLKPGEVKTATFQFEVKKGLKDPKVPLRVLVVDEKLDEYISEKMELPVVNGPARTAQKKGSVRVTAAEAVLRGGADDAAMPVALAKKGAAIPVSGRAGAFYEVEWAKGRRAFVAASQVKEGSASRLQGSITPVWQREPPRITLSYDTGRGPVVVEGDKWRLEGSASVSPSSVAAKGSRLRDVFIFVNDQKVFFKVVPDSAAAAQAKLEFLADIPLKVGNNTVTIFARENDEFQSRRTLWVHRRSPAEVAARPPPEDKGQPKRSNP